MEVSFTSEELKLLGAILRDQLSSLREEIHRTDTPHFRDSLKQEKAVLDGLLVKIGEDSDELERKIAY
jgi:hypothetical protein